MEFFSYFSNDHSFEFDNKLITKVLNFHYAILIDQNTFYLRYHLN